MVVLNGMSRYHLALESSRRSRRGPEKGEKLAAYCRDQPERHRGYATEHFEDPPQLQDWTWGPFTS